MEITFETLPKAVTNLTNEVREIKHLLHEKNNEQTTETDRWQFALTNKELAEKLSQMERKYNKQFKDIYEALNYLINEKQKQIDFEKRERIGFKK